jgi:kynurenine formamidase
MSNSTLPEDVGRVGNITDADVKGSLTSIRSGKIFDLDAGRFMGVPQWDGHPKFMITSYLTPAGTRVDNNIPLLNPATNEVDLRFYTELIVTGMHIGTHIDALNHVTCGSFGDQTFGGFGPEVVGTAGPLKADASTIPPIIVDCTFLDFPRMKQVSRLEAGEPIGVEDLLQAESEQRVVPQGGALIFRTGLMKTWPDSSKFAAASGAGITIEAARWLAEEREVVLVGSDTPTVEVVPSTVKGNPHPVHDYLLRQQGIHLLENLWLEDIANSKESHGVLICLALKITGATGSMVRPILVV